MATIRFKPKYLKPIMNPKVIDKGLCVGHFKTRTTRTKPLKCGEKEIIFGMPPRPLYHQLKTGVIIEITEVVQKPIKDYTPDEMLSDVGYCDVDKFVNLLNGLNKARKVVELTKDWVGSLHTFRYVSGGEDVDDTLRLVKGYEAAWALVKEQNVGTPFSEVCKIYEEIMEGVGAE